MTTAAIALTLGIISAIAVIIVMCMIIVGAAGDPLSQFDSPDERSRDCQSQRSIAQGIEGKGSKHDLPIMTLRERNNG